MKLIILGYNVLVFAQQRLLSESSGTAMVPLAGAVNILKALRGDVSIHGMWSRKSGCFSDAFLLEVNKELLAIIQPLFASSPWPCLYWQLWAGKTPALTAVFIKPNENLNRIWHIIKYYVSILWTLCTLRKWVNKKSLEMQNQLILDEEGNAKGHWSDQLIEVCFLHSKERWVAVFTCNFSLHSWDARFVKSVSQKKETK